MTVYDCTWQKNNADWRVVDDGVMGGKSQGNFDFNEEGHAHYTGYVSLENNGGFSSIQYRFDAEDTAPYSKVVIRLKGDGNTYQFRIKQKVTDRHSYIHQFQTTGNWQTIEMNLKDFYPAFRGQRLRIPNYQPSEIEQISFLIANKKEQSFTLLFDTIKLY